MWHGQFKMERHMPKLWGISEPRVKLMAEKICGDCKFHLKRGVCPKAEYRNQKDNLAACLSTDKACELFQPNKRFNAKVLGEKIKKEYRFFSQSEKDSIWVYNTEKGIWEQNGTELIQAEVLKLLGDGFKREKVNDVIKYVQFSSYQQIENFGGSAHKIVMQNGVYDLLTNNFEDKFNPDLYAITATPVKFDKTADCPAIKKFLSEIVNEKDVAKLIEFSGYCLYKAYPIARFVILVGEGSNGKSTFLELLKNFLGLENTSGLTLQQLSENTGFNEAELFGKLANICGDIPERALKDTGTLKKLTGKDIIHANRKFRSFLTFVNYAKPIFSANKLPSSRDESLAYHRRATTIDFPNRFDEGNEETDPNIIKKLTTPEELSGFFNLAVVGLQNFLSQGKFSNEATTEEKRLDYVKRSDPTQYFCVKFVTEDFINTIEKDVVYDYYVRLCHKLGHKPTSSSWFSQSFRRYVSYAEDTKIYDEKKQVRVWKGISINLELLDKELQDDKTLKTLFLVSTTGKNEKNNITEKEIEKIASLSSCASCESVNVVEAFSQLQCFDCRRVLGDNLPYSFYEGKPFCFICLDKLEAQKKGGYDK